MNDKLKRYYCNVDWIVYENESMSESGIKAEYKKSVCLSSDVKNLEKELTSRNQEVEELKEQNERMKENSKCIHKCKHCDSMIESIYKYCPWCGEMKS